MLLMKRLTVAASGFMKTRGSITPEKNAIDPKRVATVTRALTLRGWNGSIYWRVAAD
jgi:hypothetical protein